MDASEQNDHTAFPDRAPDDATTRGSIGRSSDAVVLIGYLREAGSDKYHLYETLDKPLALNRWIEIRSVDFVEPLPVAGGAEQIRVSVQPEATLVWCERVLATDPYPKPAAPGGPRWPRP